MPTISLSLPAAGTIIASGLHIANYTAIQALLNGNLDANNLAAGAVTEAKLANEAVTTAKIFPLAVTTAKLADLNVTNAKIANGAVTQEKLSQVPAVRLYRSSDLGTTSSVLTTVPFDLESFDTDGMHNPSSNSDRITIVTPGIYLFEGFVMWPLNTAGTRFADLQLNGTTQLSFSQSYPTNNGAHSVSVVAICKLVAGDYVVLRGYQLSGGNLNIIGGDPNTHFAATRLSA